MKHNHSRNVFFILGFMLAFFLAFVFSFYNMYRGLGTLNIMPVRFENPIIMAFSTLGIAKAFIELWRYEHA